MNVTMNQRPALIEPGLVLLPPGHERYPVRGGGLAVLRLEAGDELEVVDPEGRQLCEVVAFGSDGRADPKVLGAAASRPADGTLAMLSNGSEDSRTVTAALKRRNLVLDDAQAILLFEGESRPGESAVFTVERETLCLVAAPGEAMRVDQQNPPTDLVAWVRRARLPEQIQPILPDPLAEPRLDFRIDRATAQAYEVKAGEFIQVIDVEGRQCSDFLAFADRSENRSY